MMEAIHPDLGCRSTQILVSEHLCGSQCLRAPVACNVLGHPWTLIRAG
jgi:hypothetical protein